MGGFKVKKMPKPRKGSRTEPQCTMILLRSQSEGISKGVSEGVTSEVRGNPGEYGGVMEAQRKYLKKEGVTNCTPCCWQIKEDKDWTYLHMEKNGVSKNEM